MGSVHNLGILQAVVASGIQEVVAGNCRPIAAGIREASVGNQEEDHQQMAASVVAPVFVVLVWLTEILEVCSGRALFSAPSCLS